MFLLLACTTPVSETLIDGIFLPDVEGVAWASAIDNPYFPAPVGARWTYSADTPDGLETDTVEVLTETRDVNGVTATVVYDVVSVDGVIAEETWDWYAQDTVGNVWYLGEDTCEYEDGACAVHAGAWEWGVDGALPGILMPAEPAVDGQPYFQEFYEGQAEDVGEVLAIDEAIDTPTGAYTDCVRTQDTSHLDPDLNEEKVYCPGVGNVYVEEPSAEVWIQTVEGL